MQLPRLGKNGADPRCFALIVVRRSLCVLTGNFSDIAGTNWGTLLSIFHYGRSFVDADDEYEEDSDFDPKEEHIIEEVIQKVGATSVSNRRYFFFLLEGDSSMTPSPILAASDTISVGSSQFSNLAPQ